MSEEEKNEEEVRVGVFVCHCGSNIGGLIDCKALADYAKTLPNIAHAEDNLYTCSETGLTCIKKAIKKYDLNRIVVAACTPRTHEPLFRECISETGLNPYLFNFVNIRDQCTWVHRRYPKEAFEKAKDLIKMGAARAVKLEPLEMAIININPAALVIGGGVSGMSAALSLSKQGFKTYLVEKEEKLGGRLNILYKLFPHGLDASEFIGNIINQVQNSQNLEIYSLTRVKSIDGFVGNYDVKIEQNGDIINLTVGAIIVAVGASIFTPTNLFGYDGKKRITLHELETKLENNDLNVNNIIMIQCVGSRNDERPYCSVVCCMTALKNALIIKEKNLNANITILFRDLYTPGTDYEKYYRKAREKGILFIKYNPDKLPIVEENQIKVFNEYIGEEVILTYDLLVLSTPLIANDDNKEIAQMLKVPLENNNFFLEAHVKLRPNDFATDGIYLSGSSKWPVDISEAITQGYAAASRASTILSHKTIQVEGTIATVDPETCIGCGSCEMICPYNAIQIERTELGSKATIISAACKGCGVCGASCPLNAISMQHFKDLQIFGQIYSISEGLLE